MPERLILYNPALFGKLCQKGLMDTGKAFVALPEILKLVQMRRTMASVLTTVEGQTIRIGDTIPAYSITTETTGQPAEPTANVISTENLFARAGNSEVSKIRTGKQDSDLNLGQHKATTNTNQQSSLYVVFVGQVLYDSTYMRSRASKTLMTSSTSNAKPKCCTPSQYPAFRPPLEALHSARNYPGRVRSVNGVKIPPQRSFEDCEEYTTATPLPHLAQTEEPYLKYGGQRL